MTPAVDLPCSGLSSVAIQRAYAGSNMIRDSTLENGLRVVTEAIPSASSVALSFWVGTGSRDEKPGELGMSHFLEHLLFKGSASRSALDIAQAIDVVGGDMNAFTTKECTAFYVRVLADDVDVAFDILCDIFCDPGFDPKEVDAERQVVIEEMLMHADDPGDLVHDHFAEQLYSGHALSREILGERKLIETLTPEHIRAFFEHHYRPQNLIFAAAGNLDHDEIVAGVQRRWRGRDGGERPERSAPSFAGGVRKAYKRQTDQAHLVVGVPAPDRHHVDRYAASVLDVIFGGGMSSRLFQEVRERRGLAYTVFSSYAGYDDAGDFSIYVGTAPKRARETLKVIRDEFHKLTDGVTDVELERAKRHLRATTLLSLEDVSSRMSRVGRSLLLHGDVLTADEVISRFEAVSASDIAALAGTLLSHDPVVVGVGPLSDADLQGEWVS
jgi:predicted Zn-dependent peptidase